MSTITFKTDSKMHRRIKLAALGEGVNLSTWLRAQLVEAMAPKGIAKENAKLRREIGDLQELLDSDKAYRQFEARGKAKTLSEMRRAVVVMGKAVATFAAEFGESAATPAEDSALHRILTEAVERRKNEKTKRAKQTTNTPKRRRR